jgi:hypothetical protein
VADTYSRRVQQMAQIAIVGGNGKIARHLIGALKDQGHTPLALVRNEDYRQELDSMGMPMSPCVPATWTGRSSVQGPSAMKNPPVRSPSAAKSGELKYPAPMSPPSSRLSSPTTAPSASSGKP